IIPTDTAPWPAIKALRYLLFYPTGMFFIGTALLAYLLYRLFRKPGYPEDLALATFCVFALGCALRVFAKVEPFGYCIYYAPPLFLVFLIAVTRFERFAIRASEEYSRSKAISLTIAAEIAMLAFILIPGRNSRIEGFNTTWGDINMTPVEADIAR